MASRSSNISMSGKLQSGLNTFVENYQSPLEVEITLATPYSFIRYPSSASSLVEMQHNQTKRKPHKRSRKGCTRCKGRHVRCDEVVPICGNCFKYGHECSLLETRPFEIGIMSPNDFATTEPEEGQTQTVTIEREQPQYLQYAEYSEQPQYSQQPQPAQYSQCPPYTQSYDESCNTSTIHYHDPLRSDLTPEAVSALNCYIQVCAESPLPTYGNQMVRREEDPDRANERGGSSYGTEASAEGGRNNVTFKY